MPKRLLVLAFLAFRNNSWHKLFTGLNCLLQCSAERLIHFLGAARAAISSINNSSLIGGFSESLNHHKSLTTPRSHTRRPSHCRPGSRPTLMASTPIRKTTSGIRRRAPRLQAAQTILKLSAKAIYLRSQQWPSSQATSPLSNQYFAHLREAGSKVVARWSHRTELASDARKPFINQLVPTTLFV